MTPTIDIIIPTYRPDHTFVEMITRLLKQTYPIQQIIIMNTESNRFPDDIFDLDHRIQVHTIAPQEFDHGGTRHQAATLSHSDLMLFMTQDAMPVNSKLIEELVHPFRDDNVMAAYARQLAKNSSNVIEAYTRSYNYPSNSHIHSASDLPIMGIKTYFCSNVCAVYRKKSYTQLGGFVTRTIFNEDMIMAAQIIKSGYKVAYVADAQVIHSHEYSMKQLLQRNFDLAVSQTDFPEVFQDIKSTDEGLRYVKKVIRYLIESSNHLLIPRFLCESGFKYVGYKLGSIYKSLPMCVIKKITMNPNYWK